MRKQLRIITVIATVLLLTCLSVVPVAAQPPICTWDGTATLDGDPGDTVTAKLEDDTVVGGPVDVDPADASFYMRLIQEAGVPAEGETLYFYVDGFLGGTSTWNAGGLVTLDLAAVTGPTYTLDVAISPAGGGTVTDTGINCPGDCTQDYAEDTVVELTAAANEGFEFVNWTGDAAGTNPAVEVTMDADKTVIANFRVPGEFVLEPGLNTLSTPAYLASTLGDILKDPVSLVPYQYGVDWTGFRMTGGVWVMVTNMTTITPLQGFAIINWTAEALELPDTADWPWAEWEPGDTPMGGPVQLLAAGRWNLVGPAPGVVNGVAPDISVDDFMAGAQASRVVSPDWGDQDAWTAIYYPLWGWDWQMVRPYKAYLVFVTAASQLTGSCTLP